MKEHSTIIHLGMPKTATKAFQNLLFARHSQVHYLGKFGRKGMPKPVHTALLRGQRLTKPVKSDGILSAALPDQLAYCDEHKLKAVLSKEGLSSGSYLRKYQQALLFRRKFGKCKIVFFIREPVSFTQSYYAEMMKAFQLRTHKRGWMLSLPPAPYYFDINEYLEVAARPGGVLMQYLKVADTASIYARVFGRKNVKIYIFEEFCKQPEKTILTLCQDIGIDSKEALELMGQKRVNERITTGYTQRLQELEASGELTRIFQGKNPAQRQEMLRSSTIGEKISPQLSQKWINTIENLGIKQSRRLLKGWNLPLDDYGYPL